jgi:nucleotidyltransferase substrate binding protein (TIGR01987 family)
MSEALILTPLTNATDSLALAIEQPKNEFIRDAVIQRFEYTYELCWKFIKRDLTEDMGADSINMLSRRDLFRVAADKGLIDDPMPWFTFHKARNETSHTYNKQTAEKTYEIALEFLPCAQCLVDTLVKKHA